MTWDSAIWDLYGLDAGCTLEILGSSAMACAADELVVHPCYYVS